MTGRTGGWLARTPRKTKRRSLPTARRLSPGANDYRLYEPSENRYDSSGGVYRSTDGGTTWSAGFLPGLVRADTAAPGPYESAGDPAVVVGPKGHVLVLQPPPPRSPPPADGLQAVPRRWAGLHQRDVGRPMRAPLSLTAEPLAQRTPAVRAAFRQSSASSITAGPSKSAAGQLPANSNDHHPAAGTSRAPVRRTSGR